MSTQEPCPTPQQMEDLQANALSAAEASAIRRHRQTCPKCLAAQAVTPAPAANPSPFPFLSPPRGKGELGWLEEHRVLGVLGEGGMSYVFDAEDTQLGRRVALKVLRPHLCDATTRERFLREARLIAGLPHDHIVTVFRVGEENDVPYLTMERLEGASVEDRLKRDKWLPLTEALSLTREAAEGLVVAHEAGLVHRDIKPANLWLETQKGRFRRVKLIDFGIARIVNEDSSLTKTGQVLGTPMYMSPEQAQGKPVDGRTDLYSLGCVLYHMLTGRPPFDGREPNTMALLHAIIIGDAPKVAETAPQLPGPVAELVQSLIARDPEERPENARALVDQLKNLQETMHTQLASPRVPAAAPAARGLIRRPGLLGIWLGIFAVAAALIVGVAAMFWRLSHGDDKAGGGNGDTAAGPVFRGEPLKLGLLHSLTGPISVHGKPVAQATKFAVDEINAAGGVAGRRVDVVEVDGRSNDDMFAQMARKLIEEDKVDVIFGCWTSSARKRVEAVCREHNKLLFFSAASEGLEESEHVIYLGGLPNQSLVPLVDWAFRNKGTRRFYLIGTDAVYSRAVNEILRHHIAGLGGSASEERYVRTGESDFPKIVADMVAWKPDMILNTIDGNGNHTLSAALRAAGVTPEKIPTVWATLSEVELSEFTAEDVIGDYSVGNYFETVPTTNNRAFLKRYRTKFGPSARVNDAMETSYFGVQMWKAAVEKAGSPRTDAVRKALRGLSIEAPEGPVELDAKNLHAFRTARVAQVTPAKDWLELKVVYTSPEPIHPEPFPAWKPRDQWEAYLKGLYTKWGNRWSNPR